MNCRKSRPANGACFEKRQGIRKIEPADPPKSITQEELLKDGWIKKIIDEM